MENYETSGLRLHQQNGSLLVQKGHGANLLTFAGANAKRFQKSLLGTIC